MMRGGQMKVVYHNTPATRVPSCLAITLPSPAWLCIHAISICITSPRVHYGLLVSILPASAVASQADGSLPAASRVLRMAGANSKRRVDVGGVQALPGPSRLGARNPPTHTLHPSSRLDACDPAPRCLSVGWLRVFAALTLFTALGAAT